MKLKIGADPELFMKKGGEFISAYGAIPGDKAHPHKVKGGAVQVDGMALEFNINPAANKAAFVHNINIVMKALEEMVGDQADEIVAAPVADFEEQYMKAQPQEALELGCEPDFNAWDAGAVNPKPNGSFNFRTGAGHIHLGWTEDQDITNPDHLMACEMMTKQLDVYLGVPSLLFDQDAKRRKMYGMAGSFRPKPYGVEYRVLSNKWLNSDELKRFVFDQTHKAFNDLLSGDRAYERINANYTISKGSLYQAESDLHWYDILTKQQCGRLIKLGEEAE